MLEVLLTSMAILNFSANLDEKNNINEQNTLVASIKMKYLKNIKKYFKCMI